MSSVPSAKTSVNSAHSNGIPAVAESTKTVWNASRWLDLGERVVLTLFFAYFLGPVVEAVVKRGDVPAILVAISEGLVIGLILFRKPASRLSTNPVDWLLAFGATISPLLVRPVAEGNSELLGLTACLMLTGMIGQIYAKYTLGRRFGVVAANRGLCLSGPYRLVRHPIYFFYFLTHLGFLVSSFTVWNAFVYGLVYVQLIPRILAEERILREDPAYVDYCKKVPSRLIPGLF